MIQPKDPQELEIWNNLYNAWHAAAELVNAAEHNMDALTRASLFHKGIGPTKPLLDELITLRRVELAARLKMDDFVYTRLVN